MIDLYFYIYIYCIMLYNCIYIYILINFKIINVNEKKCKMDMKYICTYTHKNDFIKFKFYV